MPAFDTMLTDAQIADVLVYVRQRFAGEPAWRDVDKAVRHARETAARNGF